jgi:hypothetical protein
MSVFDEVTGDGRVVFRPVLSRGPAWWNDDFWSTHAWDYVKSTEPLAAKPTAEIEVTLDATLAEIIDAASDAWGLRPVGNGRPPHRMSGEMYRLGFVRDADVSGAALGEDYKWPPVAPIAKDDGSIEQVPWPQITVRELPVASHLGLIEGDVTRPYVHPVRPQGGPGLIVEALPLMLDLVRAAYAALPAVAHGTAHVVQVMDASAPDAARAAAAAARKVDHAADVVARKAEPYWFLGTAFYAVRAWWRGRGWGNAGATGPAETGRDERAEAEEEVEE